MHCLVRLRTMDVVRVVAWVMCHAGVFELLRLIVMGSRAIRPVRVLVEPPRRTALLQRDDGLELLVSREAVARLVYRALDDLALALHCFILLRNMCNDSRRVRRVQGHVWAASK